jgi:hypothetical protein
MGEVTGGAAFLHRFVDSGPGKGFYFVAVEADLSRSGFEELRMLRVVRLMTGFALAFPYRFVD